MELRGVEGEYLGGGIGVKIHKARDQICGIWGGDARGGDVAADIALVLCFA